MQLITAWLPDNKFTIRVRGLLVSPFIKKAGKNFTLAGGVTINGPQGLELGDNVYFARGTWLNAKAGIQIGDNVLFGPNVVISTAQHVYKDGAFNTGHNIFAPVSIGSGSWLAANVTVKCGVRIGEGCLVASNSSVVKDTPKGMIMAGVPAKPIKENVDGEGDTYVGVLSHNSDNNG
ncbi:acyltransferase [Phaeocystidibacter luteus]|uniref:Acyltransferase n=1 Tax=Phaeocystidibacter luteus TaxID=911197 RepID=A0A6N6RIX9_9FLAO|nr:acyltransferase [Phaeocystidibacter luteus]KAB2814346.1 acyltransferase [Phaeocystidibacter luteus]